MTRVPLWRTLLDPRDPSYLEPEQPNEDPDLPEDEEPWDGPPDYEGTGGDPK